MMSWSSLEGGDTSSCCSDARDLEESDRLNHSSSKFFKNSGYPESSRDERRLLIRRPYSCIALENNPKPFIQEPISDNDLGVTVGRSESLPIEELLANKDERISSLQKLLNCQREQLYHFLKVSVKGEMLLELKDSCRDKESLDRNENVCMALDKFKHENNLPSEQTLLREDVTRSLMRLERLIKHQENLVKSMESNSIEEITKHHDDQKIACYTYSTEHVCIEKLSLGTRQILRKMEALKIQLKKLALVEEERIHLVERVYSMPADQRQYYAHLTAIEREKVLLRKDIEMLKDNYTDLKQKYNVLQKTEEELDKCVGAKIADFDLNKIKPGLETHVELMEMVERGELSLITMTKDEKGLFTDEFVKLHDENAEMTDRLKDFDKVVQERDDLKKQIKALVESCLQLESEVKLLRLSSKTEGLLDQLRDACTEREQLKVQLSRIAKEGPGLLRICGETASKVVEERDQLRLKLTEYITLEDDVRSLRFKASQAESYRVEADRLKLVVSELEEIKAAHMAMLDKNGHNSNTVSPLDRDMYRNMSTQLRHLQGVEKQRERLALEISRYKHALLKQEEEIKDLVSMADHLINKVRTTKINDGVMPIEGSLEESEANCTLPPDAERRLGAIRNRIHNMTHGPSQSEPQQTIQIAPQDLPEVANGRNALINTLKSFLGLDNSPKKDP